jgi:hypothetical protein
MIPHGVVLCNRNIDRNKRCSVVWPFGVGFYGAASVEGVWTCSVLCRLVLCCAVMGGAFVSCTLKRAKKKSHRGGVMVGE